MLKLSHYFYLKLNKMFIPFSILNTKYLLTISFVAIAGLYFTMNSHTKPNSKLINPELKIIKEGWEGNPLDENEKFVNHEFPHINDFTRLIKWQFETNPQKEEKENDTFRLNVVSAGSFLKDTRDGMIWLGHASFMFRIKGVVFITDPIFTTPSFFQKRYSRLPFNAKDLKNIDYILLSHDHFDHLNKESIKLLVKNNPNLKVLTSLRLGKYIEDLLNGAPYQEAGWYQQYTLVPDGFKITYLPARHWSSRGFNSFNKRLWGAFMIQTDTLSLYFGGDSGWGSHFKEVKDLFEEPDYSIIGIGAYKPIWFMGSSHTSPKQALEAAWQMSAKNFIPMHFGTFDIADEPLGDPYREVIRIHNEEYKNKVNLRLPAVGEVIYF